MYIKRVKLVYAFSNVTLIISHVATPFLNVSSPRSYLVKIKHVKFSKKISAAAVATTTTTEEIQEYEFPFLIPFSTFVFPSFTMIVSPAMGKMSIPNFCRPLLLLVHYERRFINWKLNNE